MFKSSAPAAVPVPEPVVSPVELIPISVLALDLSEAPAGWLVELRRRGIEISVDGVGRLAVTADVARQLLEEERAAEARREAAMARNEAKAAAAYEEFRGRLWTGLSAEFMPAGVQPAQAMLQASRDAQPKRTSPLEDAFSGETMTFHAWPSEAEAS